MRLLYAGFESLLRKVELMVPKLTELPVITEVQTTIIFLGTVTDLIEVELKLNRATAGWLYNKNAIVFFIYKDTMYEIFISTLKDTAEEKLVAKKIIPESEAPSPGVLKRSATARITGYLDVKDVIEVSSKISQ